MKVGKFIADVMLGKLARWLRLLGFDVLYSPDLEDREIVRLSRQEDRIVLTRDTNLAGRKGLTGAVFVRSDNVTNQLSEIKDKLDFREAEPLGRCVLCNGRLFRVSGKEEVGDSVPGFVYLTQDSFLKCEKCGKVYWRGSHYEHFTETIEDIVKEKLED